MNKLEVFVFRSESMRIVQRTIRIFFVEVKRDESRGWILESGVLGEYEIDAEQERYQTTLVVAKAVLNELFDGSREEALHA